MISYYKTINGHITKIEKYELGCWINCVAPKDEEVTSLIKNFNIEPELFRASLDEEETSHIDMEEGTTLITIDTPIVEKDDKNITYLTVPLSLMITQDNVITVSLRENPIINEFAEGVVRDVHTNLKTQFVLFIMLKTATKYLQYLNQIDRISNQVEKELRKSMRNKELIQLSEIEKSLVYFSASLKSTNATLEKIMRGRYIKLYEEDQELLEDVLIEFKQAIEMSNVYLNILSRTMESFSSIISNNLNNVMKTLTSITILIAIPTLISGIYGMNNPGIPGMEQTWVPFILMVVLTLITAWWLKKTDLL